MRLGRVFGIGPMGLIMPLGIPSWPHRGRSSWNRLPWIRRRRGSACFRGQLRRSSFSVSSRPQDVPCPLLCVLLASGGRIWYLGVESAARRWNSAVGRSWRRLRPARDWGKCPRRGSSHGRLRLGVVYRFGGVQCEPCDRIWMHRAGFRYFKSATLISNPTTAIAYPFSGVLGLIWALG